MTDQTTSLTALASRPIYLVYLSVCSLLVGLLIAPFVLPSISAPDPHVVAQTLEDDHSTHFTHDHTMHSATIEIPAARAPEISIEMVKDIGSGWNLFIETKNFTFTPRFANEASVPNEGHAHIFLNGEKIGRLYGNAYHIADLEPGSHVISVSLNGNAHETFTVDGIPIEAEIQFVQPMPHDG